MKTIKLGDPMPDPCKKRGQLFGYQTTDNIRCGYTYLYTATGQPDGGSHTDYADTTKAGKRAYCSNCGNDLKLKIDRSDG